MSRFSFDMFRCHFGYFIAQPLVPFCNGWLPHQLDHFDGVVSDLLRGSTRARKRLPISAAPQLNFRNRAALIIVWQLHGLGSR